MHDLHHMQQRPCSNPGAYVMLGWDLRAEQRLGRALEQQQKKNNNMVSVAQLQERAVYCNGYSYGYGGGCAHYGSRWYRWGRWLFMALIIAAAIFIAVCFLLPWVRRRRNRQTQNQQYPTQEYQQQPQYQQSYAPQQGYNEPQYNNQQTYQAEGEGANASYYNQGTDYAPPSHPPPASAAPDYSPPSGPPPVKYDSHP